MGSRKEKEKEKREKEKEKEKEKDKRKRGRKRKREAIGSNGEEKKIKKLLNESKCMAKPYE